MQSSSTQPDQSDEQRSLRRVRGINGTQVMFAVILTIGLVLAVNFSSRVSADRELRKVRDAVVQEIDNLRREQGTLIERLAYVQGDAFAEAWARSEGRMVREGMILLVPFPSQNSVAAQAIVPTPMAIMDMPQVAPTASWEVWWSLFFDSPPPGR